MKIKFYKKNNNTPQIIDIFCNYQGYRSKILHNINPSIPPEPYILPKHSYYGEKLDFKNIIKDFNFENANYINFSTDLIEETVSILKIKCIVSEDINNCLTALAFLYNNLQKGGSAVIACMSTDWEKKGILEVLAHSFTVLKVSDSFIIAERFNEKYTDIMLSYVRYCMDSNQSVMLSK